MQTWDYPVADPMADLERQLKPYRDPARSRLYDELFREFTGFYRRNRKAYARLNRTRVREGAWS